MLSENQAILFQSDVLTCIEHHKEVYGEDPAISWLITQLRGGIRATTIEGLNRRWKLGSGTSFYDMGFLPYRDENNSRVVRIGLEEDHENQELNVACNF